MPLEKGAKPGSKGFSKNVSTEVKAGKNLKQAEAIAYSEAKDVAPGVKLSVHDDDEINAILAKKVLTRADVEKIKASGRAAVIYPKKGIVSVNGFNRYVFKDSARTADLGRVKVTVHK